MTNMPASPTKTTSPTSHATPSVFISSPFRPMLTDAERKTLPATELMELRDQRFMDNVVTALTACAFAVSQGKLPMAPHAYFTRFMDDDDPVERAKGIRLGHDWLMDCEELWVMSETISPGMKDEIILAQQLGLPIKYFVPYNVTNTAAAADYYLPVEEPAAPGKEADQAAPSIVADQIKH